MKRRFIIMIIAFGIVVSCKKEEKKEIPYSPLPPKEQPAATQECYEYIQGNDTIQASLTLDKGLVSGGNLTYNLFEKDKNTGAVEGVFIGDTLLLNYTFKSEGTTSTRQVAFLRKNKSLIEGYGESEEKEGKMVFKDLKKVDFNGNVVLNQIPCQ